MAGYGGGHPQECPRCGSPPWESCGKSHLDASPCLRKEADQCIVVGMPKAEPLHVKGDDFYTDFGRRHGMSRGEAKLYVLGQLYGRDYDPGDPRNEALREDVLAALSRHGGER